MFTKILWYSHIGADSGYDGVKLAKMGKSEIDSAIGDLIVACRRLYLGLEAIGDDSLSRDCMLKFHDHLPTFLPILMNRRSNLWWLRTAASNRDNRRFYLRRLVANRTVLRLPRRLSRRVYKSLHTCDSSTAATWCLGQIVADSCYDGVKLAKMGKYGSQLAIGDLIVACRRLYLGFEAIGGNRRWPPCTATAC